MCDKKFLNSAKLENGTASKNTQTKCALRSKNTCVSAKIVKNYRAGR
jgi:hypothetical protein